MAVNKQQNILSAFSGFLSHQLVTSFQKCPSVGLEWSEKYREVIQETTDL